MERACIKSHTKKNNDKSNVQTHLNVETDKCADDESIPRCCSYFSAHTSLGRLGDTDHYVFPHQL
jgi:hypothetical protein